MKLNSKISNTHILYHGVSPHRYTNIRYSVPGSVTQSLYEYISRERFRVTSPSLSDYITNEIKKR